MKSGFRLWKPTVKLQIASPVTLYEICPIMLGFLGTVSVLAMCGCPAFIRSDNGPEFIAQAVRDWIAAVGAKTAYIEPGSPWECGGRRKQCGALFS